MDPDPGTVMVLLDRRVPLVNEVTDVMKERGWSVYLDGEAISAACAGIMDWEEMEEARQRATLAEIRRVRADQAAAEAVVRERRASNPRSAVTKFATDAHLREVLDGIEPDPRVVGVPGLSSFGLRLSSTRRPDMDDTSVAGADHNTLVLYVGSYRPGIPSMGGFYLVYDAWANSLSAIPQLPPSWPLGGSIGAGVLGVLRHALPSDYVLAELVLTGNLPKATLWTWWSSGPFARRWIDKSVILPPEVCTPTTYNDMFCADTTFSFGTDTLCWVDLLAGILTCNMLAPEPVFQFIPLPEGCSIRQPPRLQHGRQVPEECRSMCCGNDGLIRFVCIDGYHQGRTININENVFLRTWSLSPNLKEWKQEAAFCIGDLWSDTAYLKLPPLTPTWPVQSIIEDDVVFLYLADTMSMFTDAQNTEQYMVGINVRCRQAFSVFKFPAEGASLPRIFPSNFSSYLNKRTQWNELLREKCENELIERWENEVTSFE